MDRRRLLSMVGAAGMWAPAVRAQPRGSGAQGLRSAPIIDMQTGLGPGVDAARALADVKASGLTAISTTVGPVGNGPGLFESLLHDIADLGGLIDANPDAFLLVRRSSDFARARELNRLGLIINVQDTSALEGEVNRVKTLKDLGVRVVQLTYNRRNLCGDGCLEPGNAGLSEFGRQVIGEVNANRLLLDLSHGGQMTTLEAAKASQAPPAITHTGCRDLVDNPRNTYDREMKAVADKGGVIGIYFMNYLRVATGGKAENGSADDVIRHIEHALNVCGEDHIGIGTDGGISAVQVTDGLKAMYRKKFDFRVKSGFFTPGDGPEIYNWIPDFNSPDRLLRLGAALRKRGWPAARVEKLLGGNFDRLLRNVLDG